MVYTVTTTQYFQEDPAKLNAFRNLCNNLWNDYSWRARNFLLSTMSNGADSGKAREWVQANITDLVSVFREYYNEDTAQRFKTLFESQSIDIMQYIEYAKNFVGKSLAADPKADSIKKKIAADFNDIYDFMANLNPNAWNTSSFNAILSDLWQSICAQAEMRHMMMWNDDLASADKMFDSSRELSMIFSESIIRQRPEKFSL